MIQTHNFQGSSLSTSYSSPDNPSNLKYTISTKTTETSTGSLMGSKHQTSYLKLTNPRQGNKEMGEIMVRCQSVRQSSTFYTFNFNAEKIDNVDSWFDFWDKSDPYLKFLKIRSDNTYIQAARSQVVYDSLNPSWKTLEINQSKLINTGNSFKIECWDWQEDGKDQFIGQAFVNVNQLKVGMKIYLKNTQIKKPGILFLNYYDKRTTNKSFLDYLKTGLQLNMMVAIDFTLSNDSPKQGCNLHFISQTKDNYYQSAIKNLTDIILNYDHDHLIPAYGFGGKPKGQGVNHCFPLSGDQNSCKAKGVQDFMGMYKRALKQIDMSGPTHFSTIISESIKRAKHSKYQSPLTYYVVLILTDGQINDMQQTINLLIEACTLPLSFIIVGIGNLPFDNMQKLDNDKNQMSNKMGIKSVRDLVQFVAYRDVKYQGEKLAQELLKELPNQVVQYMNNYAKY